MPGEISYPARPLAAPREYAGYQFFARLSMEGQTAEACFRYTALTVQNWLCERIRNAGSAVPDYFCCPPAESFPDTPVSVLKSASSPVAGIESLPEEGIWSLWVREPDTKVNDRSFVTRVAVRIAGAHGDKTDARASASQGEDAPADGTVELGVRTDVIDRDPLIPETEAYRPKFIRQLFQTQGMSLCQTVPLPFKRYGYIDSKRELGQLTTLLADADNLMPAVIFTYAEQPRQPVNMEDVQRQLSAQSGFNPVPFSVRSGEMTIPKSAKSKIMGKAPAPAPRKVYPVWADTRESDPARIRNRIAAATDGEEKAERFLPYDAAEFAKHSYGFCHVFVLAEDLYTELNGRCGTVNGGDILLAEPAAFGGSIQVYPFKAGLGKGAYNSISEDIAGQMRRYSVHKPYRFGETLFAEAVREYKKDREIERALRDIAAHTDTEKKLLKQWEEEHARNRELEQQLVRMERSLVEEYQKGAHDAQAKNAELSRELTELRAEKADWEEQRDNMLAGFADAKGQKESLANLRAIGEMPKTAEDVVKYFRRVFADRIDFTEQGKRTAAGCSVKPEELWQCLYACATELCEIHRDNLPDVEQAFKNRTGRTVASCEGAQTRSNPRLMALRKDTYQGRDISIEPHVKFDRDKKKVGAAYQRLYYCYDAETRRIIVGFVGDHLENHSSLSFS